jgi:hypothetical protein
MSAAGDKLARSRLAIIEHVHRKENKHERREARREQAQEGELPPWAQYEDEGGGVSGWLHSLKRAATNWWRTHPASLGLELATPMLSSFAARKPAQFLGIAAVAGAVFMVARPWRLISATGLIVALVKSSQLSSVVMSAMSAADFHKDHSRR